MEGWEQETDTLLMQVPAIGCGFRKTWFDGAQQSRFVPALNLVVDNEATSLGEAPQVAEVIEGVFPHHIRRDIALGRYRPVPMGPEEHEARTLLEVQCYYDLDGDGVEEPYIVTIDEKERRLLRIVADFGPDQVRVADDGSIGFIERPTYYTKYEFWPDPEGKFYNPGLAHFLHQHAGVINTIINQMLDASTAAVSGGGFIASGLQIQGKGQASSLRFMPGEYKTVQATGDQLRTGFVERTFPQLSPVQFNLLDMILGAARDIASIKDVLSGDASNQGQVGTTLALIEQGLQQFTATYKRVYRALKHEFGLLFVNIGKYADERTVAEYVELLDDPEADFARDFNPADMDIRPVSDPSSVTKMQQMARAQFLLGTIDPLMAAGGDVREVMRRAYEAADVEDIDKLLPEPQPDPMAMMAGKVELENKAADTEAKKAKAMRDATEARVAAAEAGVSQQRADNESAGLQIKALEAGVNAARG
jgi:chaperonin GroES